MTIRSKRRLFFLALGTTVLASEPAVQALPPGPGCAPAGRPNVLWIVSEDNGPFLGCYGDALATTPNLDRLAAQGVLFERAFANAPVCAATRSSLITGMYAPSLGTRHMRSRYPIPRWIGFYPQYLREAGYYCANNSKTDYNTATPKKTWDACGKNAHYKHRAPGQPFFAIFNLGASHESSIHNWQATRHDPARVKLPPYHPDIPEMRHDWAQYYDKVEDMDRLVGKRLRELDDAGLADDTIVFYYSDHGGVLGRSKRYVFDSGTRIPLIIRFPKTFAHLAPGRPGSRTDRLVAHVDLGPTLLSLCGVAPPEHMQGQAFLGSFARAPRDHVCLFRDRMDERYDFQRAVRDKRYRYIRNYSPHRPWLQHLQYLWKAPSMRAWERAYLAGTRNEVQSRFFGLKPAEELYDVRQDSWEVNNLAADPDHAGVLKRMRKVNAEFVRSIRDSGFIPEGEMIERGKGGAIYDYVRSAGYRSQIRPVNDYTPRTEFNIQVETRHSEPEQAEKEIRCGSVLLLSTFGLHG